MIGVVSCESLSHHTGNTEAVLVHCGVFELIISDKNKQTNKQKPNTASFIYIVLLEFARKCQRVLQILKGEASLFVWRNLDTRQLKDVKTLH